MPEKIKNTQQWIIIALVLLWLGWHLAIPIDFTISDIGRHIKNGELIVHGHWDVLFKNYYSYTCPQYPFINHHWLFGVFCFTCWHYFGFTGLYLIYLILELITFYIFFRCAERYSSFTMACAFGLLSIPLISYRYEIRPEGISCLFCGLFWWLIGSFQENRIKPSRLIIGLCALQVIWVNTHVFFIMGPILTGIFWWQAHINNEKQQANTLQKLFYLLLGMCLINPSGINGFLVPFQINKAYSFPNIENFSTFYLLKANIMPLRTILLYNLAAVAMLGSILLLLIQREGFKKHVFIGTLTLILSLAAIKVNRMVGIFGFFWIPLSSYIYARWIQAEPAKFKKNIEIILIVSGIMVSTLVNCDWSQERSLGIIPGCNDAAQFFKREKISGPIFNNYDIGGYLIFHLNPQYKLFMDDRPEAFPVNFLTKTYTPMLLNNDYWQKMDRKYQFNAIFDSLDLTPIGFAFMRNRFVDPSWALVFIDNNAVIFLKRNARNADLIKRYEIHAPLQDNRKPSYFISWKKNQ